MLLLNGKYLQNLHTNLVPPHIRGESFRAIDSKLQMRLVRQANWITGLILLTVFVSTFVAAAYFLGSPPDIQ